MKHLLSIISLVGLFATGLCCGYLGRPTPAVVYPPPSITQYFDDSFRLDHYQSNERDAAILKQVR